MGNLISKLTQNHCSSWCSWLVEKRKKRKMETARENIFALFARDISTKSLWQMTCDVIHKKNEKKMMKKKISTHQKKQGKALKQPNTSLTTSMRALCLSICIHDKWASKVNGLDINNIIILVNKSQNRGWFQPLEDKTAHLLWFSFFLFSFSFFLLGKM